MANERAAATQSGVDGGRSWLAGLERKRNSVVGRAVVLSGESGIAETQRVRAWGGAAEL